MFYQVAWNFNVPVFFFVDNFSLDMLAFYDNWGDDTECIIDTAKLPEDCWIVLLVTG